MVVLLKEALADCEKQWKYARAPLVMRKMQHPATHAGIMQIAVGRCSMDT